MTSSSPTEYEARRQRLSELMEAQRDVDYAELGYPETAVHTLLDLDDVRTLVNGVRHVLRGML